jgi:RNA polymerase sigma-19 factor, ECF subfamily
MRAVDQGCAVPAGESAIHREIQTLYSDHHGWLQSWLRKKLGCTHRAADLAQDTFMRLLAREAPVAIEEPRAFLTTVAGRALSNYRRRARLEQAYLDVLADVPEALAPSPEERVILFETLLEIDRLLEGLPSQAKRAFLCAQVDGMTQADIAALLGISVSTVKRHLARAAAQCYFAVTID